MKINGIPIKKYKAKVSEHYLIYSDDKPVWQVEKKEVVGFITIRNIVALYGDNEKPICQYAFVCDELYYHNKVFSGFGKSVYAPTIYEDFEIIGEVEDDE